MEEKLTNDKLMTAIEGLRKISALKGRPTDEEEARKVAIEAKYIARTTLVRIERQKRP